MSTNSKHEIVIYQSKDGQTNIDVKFDGDTVWLNRQQMAELFGRDVKTIGKHIGNALKEELTDLSTVAKFATVQKEGTREVVRQVEYYNLDMILSVGYRVKSAEGVSFRRWANRILREYLLRGVVINQPRLQQLGQIVNVFSRSATPEIAGIASVLQEYVGGLDQLDNYDHHSFTKPKGTKDSWVLTYDEARVFVDSMKFGQESELFGREKDEMFKSALGAVYQTFSGQELYLTLQEKAANLLYMVVKNHAFLDGNKRIAAALFVWFLDKNGALRNAQNQLIIDNNALAAITLMIALSKPEEKELMCLLVMNMLENKGES
ncbi:MAG: virulence protein RhuM/Fic/DOC family protein [Planctomycetia bacterium]|nr:virulence protein RhuM/Fic/DOC family protein [Planctomycetia bacterium]